VTQLNFASYSDDIVIVYVSLPVNSDCFPFYRFTGQLILGIRTSDRLNDQDHSFITYIMIRIFLVSAQSVVHELMTF